MSFHLSGISLQSSDTQGLSNLFSDSSRVLFARSFKPEEFPSLKLDKADDTEDVNEKATTKKARKPKKVKVPDSKAESTEMNSDTVVASDDFSRTLFVGNIPITETIKSVTKLFQEYGKIDSVRLRSVPVSGAKVDDAGNQNLVKKVCVNSHKFGEQKGSVNAYIVFKSSEGATAALTANNRLVGGRHLRVDRSTPTLFDTSRTVFLGNLPHYADEEELREYFAAVLPNKQEDIEAVRLIRDPETLVGKGIGYLLLRDRDAVMKALSLHQELFKKRWSLRVTVCGKRTKRSEQVKSAAAASSGEHLKSGDIGGVAAVPGGESAASRRQQPADKGKQQGETSKKRKLDNVDFAAKRIKLKSTMTRNKYLKERHQKKDKPGKKGKRLGGVVKRAMKAANAK